MATLKYNDTTVVRFSFPASWDLDSLTAIAVAVTNSAGATLDSGDLTIPDATTLDAATAIEAISITLADDADDVFPGDRLRVGGNGEMPEARTVVTYDTTTKVVGLDTELEYAHASGAAVIPMWGTYSLDLTDTAVFTNMMDIWLRYTPDSADPAEEVAYQIVTNAFATSEMWEDFATLFPTDWTVIQSRDLVRLEKLAIGQMRDDLLDHEMDLDSIQDSALVQRGLILKVRLMSNMDGGDMSETEYNRTQEAYQAWLKSTSRKPVWQDTDGDLAKDANEDTPTADFFSSQRYF